MAFYKKKVHKKSLLERPVMAARMSSGSTKAAMVEEQKIRRVLKKSVNKKPKKLEARQQWRSSATATSGREKEKKKK